MTEPTLTEVMVPCGLEGPSWGAWRVVAKCLDGLPLARDERALFEQCTGRTRPPTEPPAEFHGIKGRRAGGSRFAGAAVVRASGFRQYRLAPGERAIVGVASSDREQARILLSYSTAPYQADPDLRGLVAPPSVWQSLRALVVRQTRWQLDLKTGVSVEVRTANYGSIRGRTYALVVADELAFWENEDGSNPATEVLAAIRPGLATLGGLLLCISSPYAKAGPLWDAYTKYWGKEDAAVLVWRAPTRVMNPTIPERVVLDALERDEASARAEWLAEFRDDVTGLLAPERLAACVVRRTDDLPPRPGTSYVAFVDVASGSGQDSQAFAIGHSESRDGRALTVIDAIREWRPPFDPDVALQSLAETARTYGLREVYGDGYGKGWVATAFRRAALEYRAAPGTRAELYLAFLQAVNSIRVELPTHARLLQQATGLQRRISSGGHEGVDHSRAGDDVVNVVAGVTALVVRNAARGPLHFWPDDRPEAMASAETIREVVAVGRAYFPGDVPYVPRPDRRRW